MAELSLPASSATNGSWLRTQATHALVRSMISRDDTWHGRYGVLPGYGVSLQDGFQDTFGATATGALELGAMAYAVRSLACTSCFHSPLPPLPAHPWRLAFREESSTIGSDTTSAVLNFDRNLGRFDGYFARFWHI